MSIDDNGSRDFYTAAAAQTDFDYTFHIYAKSDLVVQEIEADGDVVNHVVDVDYTVSGVGNPSGGTVTFLSGRTAGHTISLYRATPLSRSASDDFPVNSRLLATTLNTQFDKIVSMIQELKDSSLQGAVLPTEGPLAVGLPTIVAGWALRVLRVNVTEDGWEVVGPLGTAAFENFGTGANQIVRLTAAGKLPAVDGSLLTNLPGPASASESAQGIIEIATQAEVNALTDDTRAVTPLKLGAINPNLLSRPAYFHVITANGTWTNPGNLTKVIAIAIGGGGGGGEGDGAGIGGSGGGGGGLGVKLVDVSGGSNETVTIGAAGTGGTGGGPSAGGNGGTTSFGAHVSATGGVGGAAGGGAPGTSGVGTGGDLNMELGNGHRGAQEGGGTGGGPGGRGGTGTGTGTAGRPYGGGGGGGGDGIGTPDGGAGSPGVIILIGF